MKLLDGAFKKAGIASVKEQKQKNSLLMAQDFIGAFKEEMRVIKLVSDLLDKQKLEKEAGDAVAVTAPISWLEGKSVGMLFVPGKSDPVSAWLVDEGGEE